MMMLLWETGIILFFRQEPEDAQDHQTEKQYHLKQTTKLCTSSVPDLY